MHPVEGPCAPQPLSVYHRLYNTTAKRVRAQADHRLLDAPYQPDESPFFPHPPLAESLGVAPPLQPQLYQLQ